MAAVKAEGAKAPENTEEKEETAVKAVRRRTAAKKTAEPVAEPAAEAPAENAEEPAKAAQDGYVFAGWTYRGEAFDFGTAIYSDITLTAKWTGKPGATGTSPGTGQGIPWMVPAAIACAALAGLFGWLGWKRPGHDCP